MFVLQNTLSILERTANFIRDLKEKHEKFLMDKGEEVQGIYTNTTSYLSLVDGLALLVEYNGILTSIL